MSLAGVLLARMLIHSSYYSSIYDGQKAVKKSINRINESKSKAADLYNYFEGKGGSADVEINVGTDTDAELDTLARRLQNITKANVGWIYTTTQILYFFAAEIICFALIFLIFLHPSNA